MPIVDYPFRAVGIFSVPSPLLSVRVHNPHNGFHRDIVMLIDTGASVSIIPEFEAFKLGHEFEKGIVGDTDTASGKDTRYDHTGIIEIFSMNEKGELDLSKVVATIPKGPIGVMKNIKHSVLGVERFLEDHVLTIDYPNQKFSIRSPNTQKHPN